MTRTVLGPSLSELLIKRSTLCRRSLSAFDGSARSERWIRGIMERQLSAALGRYRPLLTTSSPNCTNTILPDTPHTAY
jgi:hypothetical protein